MTTRIFPATLGSVVGKIRLNPNVSEWRNRRVHEVNRRRLLASWGEPWWRSVRISVGGPGQAAARLRARCARAPALERGERLARGRRDRHLALPPRSLGR